MSRLEFKDTKIELLDGAGKTYWSLTVGKSTDSGGRFLRFGDEPKADLAALNTWFDTEPKNWASTQLIDVKPETVAKAEIAFAQGSPLVVTRTKKEDAWKPDGAPEGKKVAEDKIATLPRFLGLPSLLRQQRSRRPPGGGSLGSICGPSN